MNLVFAFVYWNARENTQDQVVNKFWVIAWFIGMPTNMGVVAVYSLNEEFKSILRESKNGMISPFSYVLAKTILVIPILLIFGLFRRTRCAWRILLDGIGPVCYGNVGL